MNPVPRNLCCPARRRLAKQRALVTFALLLAPAAWASCVSTSVSSTGVAFGIFSGSQVASLGTISFTCVGSGNTNYTIALSTGGSGTYSVRHMSNGPATLSYNLYRDAAHTLIWGNGTGGTVVASGTIVLRGTTSQTANWPVYGLLPAQPTPGPGAYSDTIIVTVTY